MKKLFYVLCMSALIFTGCKKSSSPGADGGNGGDGGDGGDGSTSREIFKAYCEINPQTYPCPNIASGTEVTVQDVKPVMKVTADSSEILYGAADPAAWDRGFSDVDTAKDIFLNFSTEDGSIIPVGTNISVQQIQSDLEGEVVGSGSVTTATLGGDTKMNYETSRKGVTMVRVAMLRDLGQYMFLPQLHFTK